MESLADRNRNGSVKVYLGWDVRVSGTFSETGKFMFRAVQSELDDGNS
jgi:hypothetical protein